MNKGKASEGKMSKRRKWMKGCVCVFLAALVIMTPLHGGVRAESADKEETLADKSATAGETKPAKPEIKPVEPEESEETKPAEPETKPAGSLKIESKNNAVPTYRAGEEKEWEFQVTNLTGIPVKNVIVQAELGDTADVWPFKTELQAYRYEIGDMAENQVKEFSCKFVQREDVPTSRWTIQFAVYVEGMDKQTQKFYVNTTAKAEEDAGAGEPSGDDQSGASGEEGFPSAPAGGVSNGEPSYSGGGSGDGSIPRVIVTGFTTNPAEVRAGSNFTLTIHLKNTSKAVGVKNMLFDFSAPTEGTDEQTMAPAFLPSSGSSAIWLEKIGAGKTADISIDLNAKADLLQKPYSIDVSMKYEDDGNAQIDSSSSLSIPVKQDARFELSDFEISPQSIQVGEEANVMCSLYNLGRVKLYNVKATFTGDSIEKEEVFVGNVDSGAQASIDAMLEGKKETQGSATVAVTLSYEDEAGNVSEEKKELQLEVTPQVQEEAMMMDGMPEEEQKGLPVAPILIVVAVIILIVAARIVSGKRKKARMKNEEEALLDELYGSSEDERK